MAATARPAVNPQTTGIAEPISETPSVDLQAIVNNQIDKPNPERAQRRHLLRTLRAAFSSKRDQPASSDSLPIRSRLRNKRLAYLVPLFPLADLLPMLCIALVACTVGGLYGIAHDQVTYTISPEYFNKLKFDQFAFADFGLPERGFVAIIGFLATCGPGLIAGWFLARRFLPGQPRAAAYRQLALGLATMLLCTATAACGAYCYGLSLGLNSDLSAWDWALEDSQINDRIAFVRVAYIHNASYLGAVIGLLVSLTTIWPKRIPKRSSKR